MPKPKRTAQQIQASKVPVQEPVTPIDPNAVYRVREVPALIRVGLGFIREAIMAGKLKSKILGHARVVRGQWILDWLEKVPSGSRPQNFRAKERKGSKEE